MNFIPKPASLEYFYPVQTNIEHLFSEDYTHQKDDGVQSAAKAAPEGIISTLRWRPQDTSQKRTVRKASRREDASQCFGNTS